MNTSDGKVDFPPYHDDVCEARALSEEECSEILLATFEFLLAAVDFQLAAQSLKNSFGVLSGSALFLAPCGFLAFSDMTFSFFGNRRMTGCW